MQGERERAHLRETLSALIDPKCYITAIQIAHNSFGKRAQAGTIGRPCYSVAK